MAGNCDQALHLHWLAARPSRCEGLYALLTFKAYPDRPGDLDPPVSTEAVKHPHLKEWAC
jgi:hypothetical protein